RAFRITGKANSMAAVTTIASFAALLFSSFKVFMEFGAVGCIGLLLNYVAMMCLMPALLSIAERHPKNRVLTWLFGRSGRRPTSPVSAPEWMKRLLRPTAPRAVLLVAGLLVGVSLLVLPQQAKIRYEEGLMDYQNVPSSLLHQRVRKNMDASLHPAALLIRGEANEHKVVEGLNQMLQM